MRDKNKGVHLLVLGTGHEYQRHQDQAPASETTRAQLERRLREIVPERGIELVAEESGNDREVWAALKEQQRRDFEMWGHMLEGTEIVDEPVQTIAKTLPAEYGLGYVDIRAPRANEMSVAERDAAMCKSILDSLGSMTRVLAIVGRGHQEELAKALSNVGFMVDTESFPG